MSTEDQQYVKVIGNKIFFHCDVNESSVAELVAKIHELEHLSKLTIFIKSDGGDVYSGLSALDHMRASPVEITTVADGLCASSATLILYGGEKRLAMKNARILIHQASSDFSGGKFDDLEDEKRHMKSIMRQMREVYSDIAPEKLDRLMKNDVYLTSHKCVKYGIVHGVYGQK
jgi:ATP-dependent Clp protease protease subunit